jgi:hypothetical protein
MNAPKQLNLFEFAGRAVAAPAKPATTQLTIADKRRILHVAQVMQMNPRYTALHRALLANLERWLRTLIKIELGR